jgi:two-component system, NtrC family, response regulator AtoC
VEKESPETAELEGSVLVIDDDEAVRVMLEKALTKAGHDVTSVDDGEAALSLLAKEHFDLLIIDYMLPGITGLDVLKMARANHPALMAIMITAFPTSEVQASAAAQGVYAFVTKPFGVVQIVKVCDEAIRVGLAAIGRGSQGPPG